MWKVLRISQIIILLIFCHLWLHEINIKNMRLNKFKTIFNKNKIKTVRYKKVLYHIVIST